MPRSTIVDRIAAPLRPEMIQRVERRRL